MKKFRIIEVINLRNNRVYCYRVEKRVTFFWLFPLWWSFNFKTRFGFINESEHESYTGAETQVLGELKTSDTKYKFRTIQEF